MADLTSFALCGGPSRFVVLLNLGNRDIVVLHSGIAGHMSTELLHSHPCSKVARCSAREAERPLACRLVWESRELGPSDDGKEWKLGDDGGVSPECQKRSALNLPSGPTPALKSTRLS